MIDLERELADVAMQIGSIQLGWELQAVDDDAAGAAADEQSVTASVQVHGDFDGAVHLTCPRAFALEVAARMFRLPTPRLSDDDVRDALGELANMVAGNLKSRLPGSNGLSLPTVVEGAGYEITRLGSRMEAETVLAAAGGVLTLRVYRSVETRS